MLFPCSTTNIGCLCILIPFCFIPSVHMFNTLISSIQEIITIFYPTPRNNCADLYYLGPTKTVKIGMELFLLLIRDLLYQLKINGTTVFSSPKRNLFKFKLLQTVDTYYINNIFTLTIPHYAKVRH